MSGVNDTGAVNSVDTLTANHERAGSVNPVDVTVYRVYSGAMSTVARNVTVTRYSDNRVVILVSRPGENPNRMEFGPTHTDLAERAIESLRLYGCRIEEVTA